MFSTLRTVLFWVHLVAGVVAGLVVAIMAFTGVALAFESQVIDWADRDARLVQAPAPDAARLPVDAMVARVREARPEAQVSGITVYAAPDSVVLVSTGRSGGVYVNPYTGEVREQGAAGWRAFFHTMEEWHRWLGTDGEQRALGKGATGICNAAFLLMAITGLYLWWPRKWTMRAMRPTLWFRRGLHGKARDFNWHNVIGFWSLPVLIVLTASGMVISYRWASDLVYKAAGETPPTAQGPAAAPPVKVPTPPPGAQPRELDAQFAAAIAQVSGWESATLRMGGPGGPGGAPRPEAGKGGPGAGPRGDAEKRGPAATNFNIKERGAWPPFASVQIAVDPFTAQSLRRDTFADASAGRRARTWLRFLHTGEALGWMGQLIAAIASFGTLFLVWTGYALAWRRFFPKRRRAPASPEVAAASLAPEAATPRSESV
ncbi:PepSY domain-containing protein [Corallococcus sp. M34]|uniref:PepSY-associated TM helix domain-containing protein n=1 Tax=Citreicoccus inhibens TaxID=2849499 RepID=UPI001C238398|nr:PepSY-associated TM helix domain-containing protein [Citreicoccus inhibens]MBU8894618.1 PepSY domain-containing protein [Citreicoccus inhibens]